MKTHEISSELLDLATVEEILEGNYQLALSQSATEKIVKCREYLDEKVNREDKAMYGINTGFGALYNKSISNADLEELQHNLVMSHACGVGEEVPQEIVRIMLLLKVQGLSYGHSGVQLATVQRLIDFYNHGIYPVVRESGSLGASGDLAPLASLSLPLIGLGKVNYKGQQLDTAEVLKEFGWQPLRLQSKEGLALLNGTQFMNAYALWSLLNGQRLSDWADLIAALSLDAFDGRLEPFHQLIQKVRPHDGQLLTASVIKGLLEGSELAERNKVHVQDPYSFRCIPQVHGASKDIIAYVRQTVTTEMNAVTDNPTVFPDEDAIISAGNFHGQPLALSLDCLALALAELASISERRTYKLISGQRDLPPFLVADPGLHSGLMIPQYVAASLVSQNKQLCTPASVDTIDSSNGQEDHVSMGANAATKTYRVVKNLERVLAIELLNAAQALQFRRPAQSSTSLEDIVAVYRESVPFVEHDRVLYEDIDKSIEFLRTYRL